MKSRFDLCSLVSEAIFHRIGRMVLRVFGLGQLILAITLVFTVRNLDAQPESFQEYQVKAVFLYNLTNFISWPEGTFENQDDPLKICILGEDPFGTFLDKVIHNETIKGRRIVVKRLTDNDTFCSCHILFINSTMNEELPQILQKIKGCSVLTVSDVHGFTQLGGMVNLARKGKRVRIEINVDSARRAGLVISAKLLKLAEIFQDKRGMKED